MTTAIKPLTLFKIISLVLVALCFIMMFLPWINASVGGFGMSEAMGGNVYQVSGEGCFWSVMLQIFVILFFPVMILAILGILMDRSLLVLPFAALAVLMFLMNLFTVFWAKGMLYSYLGAYSSYMSSMGVSIGVHAGVGAWLFLLMGVAAYGLLFYEDTTLGRKPFDFGQLNFSNLSLPKMNHRPAAAGWTCPGCGALVNDNQSFCANCGTRKPEPARCPACGAVLKPGTMFCANCGTKI